MSKKVLYEVSRIKEIMGVVNEQIITDHDNTWDYRKDGDQYFVKKKNSTKWVKLSGNQLNSVKNNVFGDKSPSQSNSTNIKSSPFKNKTEGDEFRQWVNNKYPNYAKEINLDVSDPYNNSYIIKAFQKYGEEYIKSQNNTGQTQDSLIISPTIDKSMAYKINFNNLKTNDTTQNICKPNDDNCAQFVNDIRSDIRSVGNAWMAYNNSTLGDMVYNAFDNLNEATQNTLIDLWLKIHKNGGGKENGPENETIKNLVSRLTPSQGTIKDLKINDIVGIFYEPSSHHEEAFYEGGKRWFTEDNKGNIIPGSTIKTGYGWGMNTHIGTVAAIKDGTPLIFHNVGGNVKSDPPSNLRICWVRRPGGEQITILDRFKKLLNI